VEFTCQAVNFPIESLRISETTSEQLKKIEGDGDKGQEPVNFVEKEGPKRSNLKDQSKEVEVPLAGTSGRNVSVFTAVASTYMTRTNAQHLAKDGESVGNSTISRLCVY